MKKPALCCAHFEDTSHGEQFPTVSGSHCGRLFGKRQAWWAHNLPKFNMADSVKKTPSLACFRQLDCVFQYSYSLRPFPFFNFTLKCFYFAFSQLPVVVCDHILLVMSNCHDFN